MKITPFETIRRTNPAGNEFWSSRDFARVLGYNDYRNFEAVIAKARTACFNSGQRLEDHFVGIDDMITIGKGGQRLEDHFVDITGMVGKGAGTVQIDARDPSLNVCNLGGTVPA